MKKIGITGGIGSGKSFIATIIERMGYPVYYSDVRSKELTNSHPIIRQGLIDLVGENVFFGGELDKKVLATAIFSNDALRLKVNQLIHPNVRQDFEDWANAQKSNLIFNEAAILFETGAYRNFDATILVYAPEELRLQRVLKRDIITKEEVLARMNNQLKDEEKRKMTPFQILNDGESPLLIQIENILEQIV
ncbi:MAG: dephospho-CoA kinase [Flavobacteriales bacterium]|nr:dephospho-CoA kinase [Flavobacteriales bacterium]